jgi:thiol-disulfide isomerase/thioredoxin
MRSRISRALVCAALGACALGMAFVGPPNAVGHAQQRVAQTERKQQPTRGSNATSKSNVAVPTASLLDADGIKQLLARGTPPNDRPLLVNFWATWCEPCREEFPDLVKIDVAYRERGLQFVGISIDDPGEVDKGVPKFLAAMHAQMPQYVLNVTDSEPVINLIDPSWGGELPATFLFDRQGHIIFQHKGRINPTELRAALDKVLNEK